MVFKFALLTVLILLLEICCTSIYKSDLLHTGSHLAMLTPVVYADLSLLGHASRSSLFLLATLHPPYENSADHHI